ncbi:Ni/Fe hydrogenase subunit alpha [candidate division WOR-3 bacterium]|nr:Ni/Fe hydrogenase subunit alpha [candidate division WOR-3 bacterium]
MSLERIKIESLARVEGHGGITVHFKEGKLSKVTVDIHEGPRLMESIAIGRTPSQVVSLNCRICAICTLSHRYAALRAMEKALEITVSPKVQLMRDLMHCGEMIESNALHVFLLALPDYFGFPSAVHMVPDYAEDIQAGLRVKKFGVRLMELTSARPIHGENPIIGGFGRYPSKSEFLKFKYEAESLIPDAERGIEILRNLRQPTYMEEGMTFMCTKPEHDRYGWVGDRILTSTGEEFNVWDYRKLTNERVVSHSMAKRSSFKNKPYMVSALARFNLLGERLDGEAGEHFRRCYNLSWIRNPMYNNVAQAIETVWALEEVPRLIDRIIALDEDPEIVPPSRDKGAGSAAVEAPRGTLYHHYEIAEGKVVAADVITPTAQFLDMLETHIGVAAETLVKEGETDDIELKLEMVARAYDPCISCSTHLVRVKGL